MCLCLVGTSAYTPPEFYSTGRYAAGPTTVWQLGALLFELLDGHKQCITSKFLRKQINLNSELSRGERMLVSIHDLCFVMVIMCKFLSFRVPILHPVIYFALLSALRLPQFIEDVFGHKPEGSCHTEADAAAPLV